MTPHPIRDNPPAPSADYPRLLTRETGLIEQMCICGVGHPHPDSIKAMSDSKGDDYWVWSVHGCCGCCSSGEFFMDIPNDFLGVK